LQQRLLARRHARQIGFHIADAGIPAVKTPAARRQAAGQFHYLQVRVLVDQCFQFAVDQVMALQQGGLDVGADDPPRRRFKGSQELEVTAAFTGGEGGV